MCDRCGDIVFLEKLDNKCLTIYEPIPKDWGVVDGKDFCPYCYAAYKDMMFEFFGTSLEEGKENEEQREV